jgi:predicted Zn-dependent protease
VIHKLLIVAAVVLVLALLLNPKIIPRLFRRLGRSTGDLARVGQELATGREVEGSPLARYEVQAGEIVGAKVLMENPPARDEAGERLLAELGGRLAEHVERREIPYRFGLVHSDEPNAFAIPGGAIFVTRPLIEICRRDPDRLAGVLAHEVIHVDRRHAVRNLAAKMAVEAGFRVATLGRGALISRLAAGMQDLLVQGYRQDQELEADLFGTRLARLAGFDPCGLLRLLEDFAALRPDGQGVLADAFQYFRSHPPVALRMERLRREVG